MLSWSVQTTQPRTLPNWSLTPVPIPTSSPVDHLGPAVRFISRAKCLKRLLNSRSYISPTTMLIPDLITGRVTMTLDNIPPYIPLIKSGKIKALAVTMLDRSPLLPEVPTIAESGFAGFDSVAAYAFFAPTGTAQPIIDRLNAEVNTVLLDPELKAKLREQGIEIAGSTPEAVSTYLNNEIAKWAKVIQEANIAQE